MAAAAAAFLVHGDNLSLMSRRIQPTQFSQTKIIDFVFVLWSQIEMPFSRHRRSDPAFSPHAQPPYLLISNNADQSTI